MKARVFIGSSVERLDIAYAIQQNLEHDCNPVVWTQGIFQLSSNTLDDLLRALEQFDFALFVFSPDDVSRIRSIPYNTVRDNVVFELGMFIGKLGKEKVFFVVPRQSENLHLPTDLMGVTPGQYDAQRDDNNLFAALGPFCHQVRGRLQSFLLDNLNDLAGETKAVKELAVRRPPYWEFLLAAELLEPKLAKITASYRELEQGLIFIKSRRLTGLEEFSDWFQTSLKDIRSLVQVLTVTINSELQVAFGEPSVAGSPIAIKTATDRLVGVGKELLAWEHQLLSIECEEGLAPIRTWMKGWTQSIFGEIEKIPSELRRFVHHHQNGMEYQARFTIPPPSHVEEILLLLEEHYTSR